MPAPAATIAAGPANPRKHLTKSSPARPHRRASPYAGASGHPRSGPRQPAKAPDQEQPRTAAPAGQPACRRQRPPSRRPANPRARTAAPAGQPFVGVSGYRRGGAANQGAAAHGRGRGSERWEESGMIEGTLITESLRVGTVLADLRLAVRRISRYRAGGTTPDQPEIWTTLDFEADEARAEELAQIFADALDKPGWYV